MKTEPIPLPALFDPQAIEAGWYARWEEAQLFRADAASDRPKFCVAFPPPNVTGELHMGHATNGTVQDLICRYKRMRGFEVLFLPGYDHAAIATQNVIEKELAREGTTKEAIGREAFNARVERWYAQVGATIISQLRELGVGMDWSRLRFTMDPAYVRSVLTAFVRFYEQGLLYRGPRIVNWCPHDQSAISDLEVQWREHHDTLYFIRYPIEGGGEIQIATVRPETMLADSGVAVHPEDPRYSSLIGRTAILPLVGRRLPIVGDLAVERGFGTGALKVTPGHDPTDYEIGHRHGLEIINAMNPDGSMNVPFAPSYDGRPALEARRLVVQDLEAGGYVIKTEPYAHQVGHCDRCDAVIEPLVSEQWFMSMGDLARGAVEASRRGEVSWHPERYERTYLDWLSGIRDWCVSRQLWLGHRIPIYYCPNGHRLASVDPPQACAECGSTELNQDPDVLDTWFSSALWPFATLGWPEPTEDLEAFYPNDLNSTAREIINLWVSRMIMTGVHFLGQVPFRHVAIHAVIQAPDGRRMSKSLGTGVDPRQIIARYGADALRAWCAQVAMSTQDVRFDESRIEGFRRFSTKLWNAARLVLASAGTGSGSAAGSGGDLQLADRWILSRLQRTVTEVTRGIEDYAFQVSVGAAYDFAWHEYCDWYLEAIKDRLRAGDIAARETAFQVLDVLLRLLHPFMPFLTEELWQRLPEERGFLVAAAWPEPEPGRLDPGAEAAMGEVIEAVSEIRAARKAAAAQASGGRLHLAGEWTAEGRELLARLARVELGGPVDEGALALKAGRLTVATSERRAAPVEGAQVARLRAELQRIEARLANPGFRAKADPAEVSKQEARARELRTDIERMESA